MEPRSGVKYRAFRVLLTEACNANCPNCFNSATRDSSRHMDTGHFVQLTKYLSANGITAIKIMGGEPTCHPDFRECMDVAKQHFTSRLLFTNGCDMDAIQDVLFDERDTVVYNFRFYSLPWVKRIAKYEGALVVFEVQVSSDCDPYLLRKNIRAASDVFGERPLAFKFTLDCMEDIFARRKEILARWRLVTEGLGTEKLRGIDHAIPYCFLKGTGLVVPEGQSYCSECCCGLIDASLILKHCNQFDAPLIQLLRGDKFIPFKVVMNHLQLARYRKLTIALEKMCVCCPHYDVVCNGGCFLHKEHITRQSMLKSSEQPSTGGLTRRPA